MNPVRAAIFQRLSGDATLTGLLSAPTAIHYHIAPQSAAYPLIVFNELDQRPVWSFDGSMESDVWAVKAVTKKPAQADEIAERIRVALDDAPLTVTGRDLLYVRRRSGIAYPEQDGADTYWHRGWQFRLITD